MADEAAVPNELTWGGVDLSPGALAALGGLPELTCGTLSPLASIPAGTAAPDPVALRVALDQAEDLSRWALPALLAPGLTVGVLAADQDEAILRQFAWPDAAGRGPGFELTLGDAGLTVLGPIETPEVHQGLRELLLATELPELPVVALTLSASELWVLAALTDAYRMTLAARRLSRLGGLPRGVMAGDVAEAWRVGLAQPNPGWAVSLFSLLAPEAVPSDFATALPHRLAEMDDADLLMVLDADVTGAADATIVFGEGLQLLVAGLAGQPTMFGFTVQRVREGQVELTVMGGWRTPNAVWLADLSGLAEDQVPLVLASRELLDDLRGNLLGGEPDEGFAMETPYTAEALGARLTTVGPSEVTNAASEVSFCSKCGTKLEAGWKFCAKCKSSVNQPNAAPSGNQ